VFAHFQEYMASLKPKLDDAFSKQMAVLLRNTVVLHPAALRATLEEGKKIRGCLLCMIHEALGGSPGSSIPRAVAVELIHAASLIHDDFVDQDRIRRNMPAVWTLEGARRAVLLGDVLFASCIKMMNDLSREDGRIVCDAIAQVSRGALYEFIYPPGLVPDSDRFNNHPYEKIIRLKTGILFGATCQLGAVSAGVKAALKRRLYKYGVRIGEAYQIADDRKDIQGHIERRSIESDQMAVLTPALRYFIGEDLPFITPTVQGERHGLDEHALHHFRTAATLMDGEIERRLNLAVSELGEDFPRGELDRVMRNAPREVIEMFNES